MHTIEFLPQIPFWQAWFGTGFIYATITAIWLHGSGGSDESNPWINTMITWAVKLCLPTLMPLDIFAFLSRKQ